MKTTTNRRTAMVLTAMTICLGICTLAQCADRKIRVYLGTYTRRESRGIYVSDLNMTSGALSEPRLAAATDNPTFLAIHPSGRFLYAAGGAMRIDGKATGLVTAFAMDKTTGKLMQLNRQSSGGRGPCHVVVDANGRCALAANYSSGSIASLPIGPDGKLRPAASVIQHKGSSVNKRRQGGPHAHSINLDRANRFAVAADLGADKLFVYNFDSAKGTLKPHDPPAVKLAPGAGPRHFAFHPSGKFAYVINELDSTITAFAFDAKKGTLAKLPTVSTLPADFKGSNTTAEVQVHPSGKFLYGSNRGHDSLAILVIDSKSGKLTPVGHQPTGGRTPRNFGIDPTGRYILAANQNSNNVVVFQVDQATGKLKPTGSSITVSAPVCVKFHAPVVKPASQPKDIMGVMRSLKAELGMLSSAYPELSGAGDIKIVSAPDGSTHTVAYTNNCTFTGKRGYKDTGANACAVALRVMTGKRYQKDVRHVAMQMPGFNWANLKLVGWTTVHVGKRPTVGFEAQMRKLISEHVSMINALDARSAPK